LSRLRERFLMDAPMAPDLGVVGGRINKELAGLLDARGRA
jgi:hypothetical protein